MLEQQAQLWTAEALRDVNCGGSLACLVLWHRTHTPAQIPLARTASGSTLDEPTSDHLGGWSAEPGAEDARDRPSSLLHRIARCEAPAADCGVM